MEENLICSMTGFGKGEAEEGGRRITVELKSVNNRYLDINIRMPKMFNAFDLKLRNLFKKYMKRGKVDVYVGYENLVSADISVRFNSRIAGDYVKNLQEMAAMFGLENDLTVTALASMPDVFRMEDRPPDEAEIWALLEAAASNACEQFLEARRREGLFLQKDLIGKLTRLADNVDYIEARTPEITKEYEQKLKERIEALLADRQVDETRLLTEVAIFADKSAIDEELVRLRSHIDAVSDTLRNGTDAEGVGRKLDFIVQEMNREANTILSKSTDMEISGRAVEIKTDIEKIREQIQNIE